MMLISTLAAVAAVVTAQGPDAGVVAAPAPRAAAVTAAPSNASPSSGAASAPSAPSAPDAGMPQAQQQQPQVVTKVVTVDNSAEVATLKSELQNQNQKLESAVGELQALRSDLASREAADQARHQSVANQKAAAAAMSSVDAQLSTGDSNVGQVLSNLEQTLGPSASVNLQYARQALANSDLATARYWLARAAEEARNAR